MIVKAMAALGAAIRRRLPGAAAREAAAREARTIAYFRALEAEARLSAKLTEAMAMMVRSQMFASALTSARTPQERNEIVVAWMKATGKPTSPE